MKKIPLTQGKSALVSDEDYEYLNQWKWCAQKIGRTFYAVRGSRNSHRYMHRVIADKLGFKSQVDHINRDGLDNRRSNLRDTTQKQNLENTRVWGHNTSGYKGVCWYKPYSKWRARITHYGRTIHLGYFDNIEDAVKARKAAEKKYFTHST